MIQQGTRGAKILEAVQKLDVQEQTELLQAFSEMMPNSARQFQRSVLELEGLGAEIWRGAYRQEYVNQERTFRFGGFDDD